MDLIHIKHSLICGPVEEREAALAADADVYITNFEQIPWLVKRYGRGWPFKTIVVDEATRLKSFRLRQASPGAWAGSSSFLRSVYRAYRYAGDEWASRSLGAGVVH